MFSHLTHNITQITVNYKDARIKRLYFYDKPFIGVIESISYSKKILIKTKCEM